LDTGIQLPAAFYDDDDESGENDQNDESHEVLIDASAAEQVNTSPEATPMIEDDGSATIRRRRISMPPSSSQASPVATSLPPRQPMAFRPRRNSSIQEPSPLARLFVRGDGDNAEIIDRLRERRQSLVGLAMPNSQSQPGISSLLGPGGKPRSHSRYQSQGLQGLSFQPLSPLSSLPPPKMAQPSSLAQQIRMPAKASSPPPQSPLIEEEHRRPKATPFLSPAGNLKRDAIGSPTIPPIRTPTPSRPQSPAPSRSKRDGIPFPGREGSTMSMTGSSTIGKASEIEARQSELPQTSQIRNEEQERDWRERLEGMEERQMRIEEMLKRLVGDT
jgi:hypothetical protein